LLLINNVTLDKPQDFAPANHSGPCAKLRLPYGPQKIDLQFNGGKTFAFGQRTAICQTHRRICDIAKYSTVDRAHRVRVTLVGLELDDGLSVPDFSNRHAQKLADRR